MPTSCVFMNVCEVQTVDTANLERSSDARVHCVIDRTAEPLDNLLKQMVEISSTLSRYT
jgi:hypothetical protein